MRAVPLTKAAFIKVTLTSHLNMHLFQTSNVPEMTFALIQTVHVKTTLELHCSFLPFQKGHREETERINIKQFKKI